MMRISLVIPLYNKRDTVLRALNSVFSQTFRPDEIIVVNDGSTDGSELVVAQLDHPLIKLVNQPNQGVSSARNRGIAEAKFDWIAFLDADDEWLPAFLETISNLSMKNPQCSALATAYLIHGQDGIRRKTILRKILFYGEGGILENYFEVAAHSNPPLWTGSVVANKNSLINIGGFPDNIHSGEDLVTWARLACSGDIAYSVIPQAVYRTNPPTVIDRRKDMTIKTDLVASALNDIKKNCSRHKRSHIRQYISQWHKMKASTFLFNRNDRKNTLSQVILSIVAYPLNLRVLLYLLLLLLPKILINKIFSIINHKTKNSKL